MNEQIKTIDNIMSVPKIKRKKLQHDCIKLAVGECNGDYYYDDEVGAWTDPRAEKLEKSIIKRLYEFSSGIIGVVTSNYIDYPDFISFHNDPRGLVLKIETSKLNEDAKKHCRDIGLVMDWGGDFTILFNNELK